MPGSTNELLTYRGGKPLLTVEEVAQILRCSQKHVYDLCRKKRIPCIYEGGRYLFDPDEFDKWIENKKVEEFNRRVELPAKKTGRWKLRKNAINKKHIEDH